VSVPPPRAVSDLSSCDSRPCFDCKLALFGAFGGFVREALPDAVALSRLACRVRTLVGQGFHLVVRRIINDTIGIVSHDRSLAHPLGRLATLAVTTPTRPHLASVLRHPPFVTCRLPLVVQVPGTQVPGRVAPGDCSPGAPADPYLHFRAYGSSYHELATGRLPE